MSWPFVRAVVHREETASTSDLARALVLSGETALPLLVRADRQTRGRGRGANGWWSDAGSLTFTIAIGPEAHGLTISHEPRLALAAAVAVVGAVSPFMPPTETLGIRWPNDVEAGGRKLAGILPERVETGLGLRLLIGIGLNVGTRLDDAPPEVRRLAASLAGFAAPGSDGPDPDRLLATILEQIEAVLPRLAGDDPSLAARWSELDTLRRQSVRVDLGPRVVAGIGRGIDADGALCLETAGETRRIYGGRVLREV